MPFTQRGPFARANISNYIDVAGNLVYNTGTI